MINSLVCGTIVSTTGACISLAVVLKEDDMPRIAKPLTNTQIKSAVSKAKKVSKLQELNDGSGLKLRISAKGSASWLFNYHRPYSNKRNNIGIGAFPNISLKEAREFRTKYRALLAKDIDPLKVAFQKIMQMIFYVLLRYIFSRTLGTNPFIS